MNLKKKIKDKDISIILIIIKNMTFLFACILFFQCFPEYWTNISKNFGNIDIQTVSFLLCTLLAFIIFTAINIAIIYELIYTKWLGLIEMLFYIFIVSLPIFLSHSYKSEFKYIFLLIIIAAVIQYGLHYGLISAILSAAFILGIDIIYAPIINGVNEYFENDLVIVGVFIFIAWILGYYVDLVNENKKEKENQLQLLSSELEVQNIKRNDIEKLLLNNKICYDILFENSENAILVHSDEKIIYANESAAKLLGYDNSMGLDEKPFFNHYAENFMEAAKAKYMNIIDNQLSKIVEEETILNCNGASVTVRNTSSFFIYEGHASVLTFLLDITTEKQLQTLKNTVEKNLKLLNETREFNILITDFFTNISHEIKTPINVIYVAIQTMAMYLDNYSLENIDKCKSYLKIMKQNCFRMIRLVNNLLDITRFDSGFISLNKKNNNIVSVVEDIIQSIAAYIKSKNIELVFDTDVEEKIMAFDSDMIERIMLNLLSNAFKYSHSNGTIMVTLNDMGSDIVITVKDEGDGIPKDKLSVIFERFGQVNTSLSRKAEGSGIGLYLVKSFVEMHHGKITVSSTEGIGTEFTIILPAKLIKDEFNGKGTSFETNIDRINIEFSDIYTFSNDE